MQIVRRSGWRPIGGSPAIAATPSAQAPAASTTIPAWNVPAAVVTSQPPSRRQVPVTPAFVTSDPPRSLSSRRYATTAPAASRSAASGTNTAEPTASGRMAGNSSRVSWAG